MPLKPDELELIKLLEYLVVRTNKTGPHVADLANKCELKFLSISFKDCSLEFLNHPLLRNYLEEYDLALLSDQELKKYCVEFKCTEAGLQYRVIGLDNAESKGLLRWVHFPSDMPRTDQELLLQRDKYLALIIHRMAIMSGEIHAYALRGSLLEKQWFLLALYTHHQENSNLQQEILSKLERNFKYFKKSVLVIPNINLLKQIYSFNDDRLIALAQLYLPIPRSNLFIEGPVPPAVLRVEQENDQRLAERMQQSEKHFHSHRGQLENAAIKLQRRFRKILRREEEVRRIAKQHSQYISKIKQEHGGTSDRQIIESILIDANTPYTPKTTIAGLANRIVSAAKKIHVYSTIRHVTSSVTLVNVLNENLYGRRNLINSHRLFTPAALDQVDVDNGDENVICFGFKSIDPRANGNIEITLNLEKLRGLDLPAFYKVQDLGFATGVKDRAVKLIDRTISCTRGVISSRQISESGSEVADKTVQINDGKIRLPEGTEVSSIVITEGEIRPAEGPPMRLQNSCVFVQQDSVRVTSSMHFSLDPLEKGPENSSCFYIYDEISQLKYNRAGVQYKAFIPYILLIAYDIENIDQIMALNFFRFIDNLVVHNSLRSTSYVKPAEEYIADFYQNLNQMTDEELQQFLVNAAKELTVAAEFNFYGGYQIDFSTLKSVRANKKYELDIASFITELNGGSVAKLHEANREIPNLFKSYRFIDFLLTEVDHLESRRELAALRQVCYVPPWANSVNPILSGMPACHRLSK